MNVDHITATAPGASAPASIRPRPANTRATRLLLTCSVFPPILTAESVMVLKKVRVLARHFAITVVTIDDRHGRFAQDELLARYVPGSVNVIRVPSCDPARRIHRAAHLAHWMVFRNSQIMRYFDRRWVARATPVVSELLRDRCDVLLTNAQDMCAHLVGHRARSGDRIPWVQHYSDPPFGGPFTGDRLSSFVDRRAIRRFLSDASLVTMPSCEMADRAFTSLSERERRRLRARTTVVPHTFDVELMRAGDRAHPDAGRWFGDRDVLHVCYVGSLYGVRGGDLLLRAARRLRAADGRRIAVHVVGHVDDGSAAQLSRADVRAHGNVGYLESLAVMQRADALLLLDVASPRSPFFPSKLADYLGTDRPIVAVADADSAVTRIARSTGLTLAAWDEAPIVVPGARADTAARAQYVNSDRTLSPLIAKLNQLAGVTREAGGGRSHRSSGGVG